MLILTQDRLHLVNLDNVLEIFAIREDIIRYYAYEKQRNEILLGRYYNTPEHENQIERIAEVYGAINCYVMPKEEI